MSPKTLPDKPRVLTVTKRWEHHSESGGFDRLSGLISRNCVSRCNDQGPMNLRRRTLDRWWSTPVDSIDYQYADYLAERRAYGFARKGECDVLHYLYGDEQLNWVLRHKSKLRCELLATFHLPWFRARERFDRQRSLLLDNLDKAVAVSRALARDLSVFFGDDRVKYIPHGIDVNAFRPSPEVRADGPLRLLTVGFHMRDLELIHRIVDHCFHSKIEVQFTFVGPESAWVHFTGCSNLVRKTNVTEAELIELYQGADALLLPVIAATANNSLLEALACGLPVLSTDTEGIVDYLDVQSGWLLPPNDMAPWVELVTSLAEDPEKCSMKSAPARQKAQEFAWENVVAQYREFYAR